LCLTLLCGRADDWIAVMPEGYYDASLSLGAKVTWRIGELPVPREAPGRIEKALHRSSEVAKVLSGLAASVVSWSGVSEAGSHGDASSRQVLIGCAPARAGRRKLNH